MENAHDMDTTSQQTDKDVKDATQPPAAYWHKRAKSNVDPSLIHRTPNPYRWPPVILNFGMEFNGVTLKSAPVDEDPMTRAAKIRSFHVRSDDIFLLAFPKCGTHWVSDIINMLLKGSSNYNDLDKHGWHLEYLNDLDALHERPSPRYFHSHLWFAELPQDIPKKSVKLVHIMRNAKDAAVSWFHHLSLMPNPHRFTFDEFLLGYLSEGYSTYGHQFNYLRQITEFVQANPRHPIMHIHFEDLKTDPFPVLKELSRFLQVSVSGEFINKVIEACSLENMRKAREVAKSHPCDIAIYRKGLSGDWKNTFTAAQSEKFDRFVRDQERKGFGFKLKGVS